VVSFSIPVGAIKTLATQFADIADRMGADNNAQTSNESTYYQRQLLRHLNPYAYRCALPATQPA
jgi:hypothetical protein